MFTFVIFGTYMNDCYIIVFPIIEKKIFNKEMRSKLKKKGNKTKRALETRRREESNSGTIKVLEVPVRPKSLQGTKE